MKIQNAVIVVTGGAQGLGLETAKTLSEQGAKLVLVDRNEAALHDASKELSGPVEVFACDVTNEAQVESVFESIWQKYGQLNGLVNCAGIMRDGLMIKVKNGLLEKKMSLEQFQSVIDVNLTGTFLCSREAAACMAQHDQHGVIINIASVSRAGNMGQTNYSASKAGVSAFVVTWSKELARYGIRVAGIAPGTIATAMTAQMKPEALARMEQMTPVGRLGTTQELAHSVTYILENEFFNGRILELDGGLRI